MSAWGSAKPAGPYRPAAHADVGLVTRRALPDRRSASGELRRTGRANSIGDRHGDLIALGRRLSGAAGLGEAAEPVAEPVRTVGDVDPGGDIPVSQVVQDGRAYTEQLLDGHGSQGKEKRLA